MLGEAPNGRPRRSQQGSARPPARHDVAESGDFVTRRGARRAQSTDASAMHPVARDDARRRPGGSRRSATIEHLMLGGEALPTALAEELRVLLTGRITNMYGPTETTIWSLVHEVDVGARGQHPDRARRSATRPSTSSTDAVSRFHPGSRRAPHRRRRRRARLSRTRGAHGGSLRPSGSGSAVCTRPVTSCVSAPTASSSSLGRVDFQVKIRGHRIELGEVEAVIDTHPDVVQSVVVAHRPAVGDLNLVAVVIARDGAVVDERVVRERVADRLPAAYVPARVITVPSLPLTPNGKTDRGSDRGRRRTHAQHRRVRADGSRRHRRCVGAAGRRGVVRPSCDARSVGTTTSSTSVATRCSPSPCSDAFATGLPSTCR